MRCLKNNNGRLRPMSPPLFSTFSAIAEFFVTLAVFYVVLRNFKGHGFAWKLAGVVAIFEFSVNMLYMISRMQQESASGATGMMAAFAAGHGFLSLLVYILFVVFCFLAYRAFNRREFFFQANPAVTYSFLALWMVSVSTGWALYYMRYFA
jgi:uncharacterized membrane protein YozB (DUF420 family)